ncbi:MAG: hypothetical protein KKC72_13305 [Alphaproteobacteria bacterium]|jgi:hypothetical protein|nr:hypothetical protein [Alphaproteobacteria bacterium]|tara:strand:- start:2974 stop:3393 length:420 start_codon:yes stop_codon:yes gene_type:complete
MPNAKKAAKPRRTSRTDRARETFLATLRETCNVSAAARAAKIGRSTAYDWRDADEAFAAAWDDAEEEAVDALEMRARERALDNSDRMMEILLKAHRPDKYVDKLRSEISGPGGDAIPINVSSLSDEQLAALEAIGAIGT